MTILNFLRNLEETNKRIFKSDWLENQKSDELIIMTYLMSFGINNQYSDFVSAVEKCRKQRKRGLK